MNFLHDPMLTQWEYDFNTKTTMFYVEDEVTVGEQWVSTSAPNRCR